PARRRLVSEAPRAGPRPAAVRRARSSPARIRSSAGNGVGKSLVVSSFDVEKSIRNQQDLAQAGQRVEGWVWWWRVLGALDSLMIGPDGFRLFAQVSKDAGEFAFRWFLAEEQAPGAHDLGAGFAREVGAQPLSQGAGSIEH